MDTRDWEFTMLSEQVGFVWLDDWSLIEIAGQDRKTFLHSFCTADIKQLEQGQVVEAFVLDNKGKTLGYAHVAAVEDKLWLLGAGDQAATVIEHLDRYLIREDVTLTNCSSSHRFSLLAGPQANQVAATLLGADVTSSPCQTVTLDGTPLLVIGSEFAGPGVGIVSELAASQELGARVVAAGIAVCGRDALEPIRLASGTPWFGIEVNPTNLPQEIDRDDKAISFTKGCYLGQETVARIDALGRVNRLLRVVEIDSAKSGIKAGDAVVEDGKEVGQVLAVAAIPDSETAMASMLLRRSHANPGTEMSLQGEKLTVVTAKSFS